MNRWAARRSLGIWVGLLLVVALWGGAVWAGMSLAGQLQGSPKDWPLTLESFGLLLAALGGFSFGGIGLYRALSALTLYYRIDRNAVTIHWLGNTAVVPMDRITAVDIGVKAQRLPTIFSRSFGYRRGTAWSADDTPVYLFATTALPQTVILYTSSSAYAISPAKRDAFVQEVEGRRGLGIVQGQTEGVVRTTRVSYPFWTDRTVRACLALGLVLNLALWGILSSRYTQLAETVALRFDATGSPVSSVSREQVLALPLIGLLAWLANAGLGVGIYRLSRVGTVLLLVGAIVIQSLLAVSLLGIIS